MKIRMVSVSRVIVYVIIMAVAGAGILFWKSEKAQSPTGDSSGLIIGNNAIYVSEQKPGSTVLVSLVRLTKAGFAVIHEDGGGKPGMILGASNLLAAGETRDLGPIVLSRPLVDGETFYVMLYIDNGDGQFDAGKDYPALDPLGKEPVMMVAGVSQDASESGIINP